jgi:hypothetical protein
MDNKDGGGLMRRLLQFLVLDRVNGCLAGFVGLVEQFILMRKMTILPCCLRRTHLSLLCYSAELSLQIIKGEPCELARDTCLCGHH